VAAVLSAEVSPTGPFSQDIPPRETPLHESLCVHTVLHALRTRLIGARDVRIERAPILAWRRPNPDAASGQILPLWTTLLGDATRCVAPSQDLQAPLSGSVVTGSLLRREMGLRSAEDRTWPACNKAGRALRLRYRPGDV
jgi:hypothetical protein